jgi:hypothetical protein
MSLPADRVLQELDPDLPLYAVLDGARDSRIRGWATNTRAPLWCLYIGKIPTELEDAAPWLMRIGRGHDSTDWFFKHGWPASWGVLFASDAPQRELRRHLRKFLRVRTEDKRTLIFRYYDPGVLRVYLPTCTPEELKIFFGPIKAFAARDADATKYHVFSLRDGNLETRTLELPAAA